MDLTPFELSVARVGYARERSTDARQRRREGIVHTPPALARAVVEGLDRRLYAHGFAGGLCGPEVAVVDPACGPGAFVAAVLACAAIRGRAPRVLHAWDTDSACIAHVETQLGPVARALGCELQAVRLDSLREGPCRPALSGPVAVVGNPPWSVVAAERNPAMQQLLEDFRRDGRGVRLAERKLGVLSDSYVRFFRLAMALLQGSAAGGGLGLVTNGSFLDGPVHRGMRHALLRWCDAVDLVDLGGSALLARRAGSSDSPALDENVFGVRPAVAVTWAVVRPDVRRVGAGLASVHTTRLSGRRADKLGALKRLAQAPCPASSANIDPQPPFFLFLPAGPDVSTAYRAGVALPEAMPFHREGVQTNRDGAVVSLNKDALLQRLRRFAQGRVLDAAGLALTRLSPHYQPTVAQQRVREALARDPDGTRGLSIQQIAYRPFDTRYFVPIAPVCHRPRPDLLRAMAHSGFALLAVRKDRGTAPYRHASLVGAVADSSYLSARSSCRTRVFPERSPTGAPNFDPAVGVGFSEIAGVKVGVCMFVDYALALLHSPRFTAAFDRALRIDYPRIPYQDTSETFARVAALGRRLHSALLACECVRAAPDAGPARCASFPVVIGHLGFAARPALGEVADALAAIAAHDTRLPASWFF